MAIDNAVVPQQQTAPVMQGAVAPSEKPFPIAVEAPKVVDHSIEYEKGVLSSDPKKLLQVAQNTIGTPASESAFNAANMIQKNRDQFENLAMKVEISGGIDSQKGRIALADAMKDPVTYQTNMVKAPGFWYALGQRMMGDKEAYKYIDGGAIKPELRYATNTGQQIELHQDQLGRTHQVVDVATRQIIPPEEYQKIGVGLVDPEKTLGYRTKEEIRKFNTEKLNLLKEQAFGRAAAVPELSALERERQSRFEQLAGSDLSNETLQYLSGLSSRQIGFGQNVSQGQNAFDQYTRQKGVGVDQQTKKAAEAYLKNLGSVAKKALSFGADGSVIDSKNNKLDQGELSNLQDTFSKSFNNETNFTQAKEEAKKSAVYQGLGKDQKDVFDKILDISKQIEKKNAELDKKYGPLPFTVPTSAYEIGDQFKRGQIQSNYGEFNAEVSKLYGNWVEKQVTDFAKYGQVPPAGSLEKAFSESPEYKKLQQDYKLRAVEIWKRRDTYAPTIKEAGDLSAQEGQARNPAGKPSRANPITRGRQEEEAADLLKKFTK